MALVKRVSRIFRADLHAVLDCIEEPAALLRHAIGEMEDALAGDRRHLEVMGRERRRLVAGAAELDRSLAAVDDELDLCFASGNENLARTLTARKLEGQRFRRVLEHKREALDDTMGDLEARIREHAAELEAMHHKADVFLDEHGLFDDSSLAPGFDVRADEIELAFLREKQRRQPA